MKSAHPQRGKSSASGQNSKSSAKFAGTNNPRHLRVIQAAWVRPISREEVDRVAGCANGPDLIAELRRCGLEFPCERSKMIDRDLFACYPGAYHFTQQDRRKIVEWKRKMYRSRGQS
jgi:hypothetical protein